MTEQEVGELIRKLDNQRKRLGWSDAELARRAGVSKSALARMYDQSNMTLRTLGKITRAMGGSLVIHPGFPFNPKAPSI